MSLTLATPADLPAVVALVNSAYRGDSAKQGWTHEADLLGGQRIDIEGLSLDLEKPGARLGVWRDSPDGDILACVWLEPAGAAKLYLGMLTVRPDLQGRQLGRHMIAAAEDLARAEGMKTMRMTVIAARAELIAWYERRGYARTGETQPFPYDDERFGLPQRDDLSFVVLEKPL
ncbi:MAG: GNAT family N-acetyltransferase [Asticcacaulis sp.]|uniref:GNAT family N-acetyltransferase n=1 Tax=Asticcacaulis sp. TaxID=1872648 RepID=UPI003F7BE33E